jgi:hypothetical protein
MLTMTVLWYSISYIFFFRSAGHFFTAGYPGNIGETARFYSDRTSREEGKLEDERVKTEDERMKMEEKLEAERAERRNQIAAERNERLEQLDDVAERTENLEGWVTTNVCPLFLNSANI